jgi:hypothetical protein
MWNIIENSFFEVDFEYFVNNFLTYPNLKIINQFKNLQKHISITMSGTEMDMVGVSNINA